MGLAVETTASTAEIWVMVIVMSAVTLFLAGAATFGGWLQRRAPRSAQSPTRAWAVAENAQAGDTVGEVEPGMPTEAAGPLGPTGAGQVPVPSPRSGEPGEAAAPYAGSGAKRDGAPGN